MANAPARGRLSRTSRRPLVVTCLVIAALLLGTGAAAPAYAKPSVGDLEKQIDAANNKLEPIVEEYDRVHAQLVSTQAQVATLTKKLTPLQLEVDVTRARLQPLIEQVYEHGPISTLTALLDADSTAALVNQLSMVDQLAREQQRQIASVVAARDRYLAAKQQLDTTAARLTVQNAELDAKKKTIEAQIAKLQKLRDQAYGAGGGPIGTLKPVACPYTYIGGAAGVAARTACAQIGKPYVWAAAGPNTFDCSGLTLYAWAKAGKTLRHYTKWQWADGTPITRAQLRPGDLVFFFPPSLHHMGMYVGGGWMVHAPTTGDVVRMARIDSLPIAGYRRP